MATTTPYTPNPLRPYYVPPASDYLTGRLNTSSIAGGASSSLSPSSIPNSTSTSSISTSSFGAALSDLDYFESPSISDVTKGMIDSAIMRYTSVLVLQPFKVAKTVMQCQYMPKQKKKLEGVSSSSSQQQHQQQTSTSDGFDDGVGNSQNKAFGREWQGYGQDELLDGSEEEEEEGAEDDDEDDDPQYFTSNDMTDNNNANQWSGNNRRRKSKAEREQSRGRRKIDREGRAISGIQEIVTNTPPWQLELVKAGALSEVLSGLWNKESFWGVWKGSNSTFVYTILTSTIEAWSQSFISALLNLPDPALSDLYIDTTIPLTSLLVAVASSSIAALILSPLDIVRTRLILTPVDEKPRQVLPLLKKLPHFFCPLSLILPTIFHAALPTFVAKGAPYYLKTRFGLEPAINPTKFSLSTLLSSSVELFVRLPVETVLRRGQIAASAPKRAIVPVGRFNGSLGTLYTIYKDEEGGGLGGIEGLYRGWKVGIWGLVGMWVMSFFGGTQNAGVTGSPF